MIFVSIIAWTVFFGLLAFTLRYRRKSVRIMERRYAAWHRQRWSINMFNGRHNLGFGYYLHRSTS